MTLQHGYVWQVILVSIWIALSFLTGFRISSGLRNAVIVCNQTTGWRVAVRFKSGNTYPVQYLKESIAFAHFCGWSGLVFMPLAMYFGVTVLVAPLLSLLCFFTILSVQARVRGF